MPTRYMRRRDRPATGPLKTLSNDVIIRMRISRGVTRLPKHPHCEVCAKAKIQRRQRRGKPRRDDDEPALVMFGDHCPGSNSIKRDTADDDDGIPVDASALLMLGNATGWIVVYPKASKSMPHSTEAMQQLAYAKDKLYKLILRQRS